VRLKNGTELRCPQVFSDAGARQDVGTAGITGAMMGGMLAAAALEPKLVAKVT
jgi:hypothetical protein